MHRLWNIVLFVLLAGYSLCLIAGTLSPFNFTSDAGELARRPEPLEWLPFTYVCPHCIYKAKDKLLNLVMFIPFGVCLGLLRIRAGRDLRGTIYFVTGVGFLFSLGIEFAQYFEPSRTPAASDLLLNTMGAFYGASFAWYLARGAPRLAQARGWKLEVRRPIPNPQSSSSSVEY